MTAQAAQQHTPLPWGAGLSRDTGALVTDPRQHEDLRNVTFYEGSLRIRGGLGASIASTFVAAGFTGTDVCHVAVFKAQAAVVYVVYDRATREVRVFTADLLGESPVDVGRWGILNANADAPPRFQTAEAFGILLLAHDEAEVVHRLDTFRYDPNALGPLTSPPWLRPGTVDPKKLRWSTFNYTLFGSHTKATAEQAIAGLTVTAGTWGAMLVQINAAGVVTTKVVGAIQGYDTEPLALAALPGPDGGNIELGHFAVQAKGTGGWVAGLHNFTTDLAQIEFFDGAEGPFLAITANLDGVANGSVRFRGVREYLGFMLGWGYGTQSDPDRPELLRISNGGDPAVYDADSFFLVGARGEPIVAAAPVSNSCALLKSVGWFCLDGTDRSNWAVRLVDPFTGCTSVRGAINIEGHLWWWSQSGPRRSRDGQTTEDPGLALDLSGPEPSTLPAKGPPEAVWALYVPDDKFLVFGHPLAIADTTRCYGVSMREPGAVSPPWAYWTLGGAILHAAVINADQVSTIPPGTASAVTTSGSVGAADASITVDWTQNDMVGDETWELWYKAAAGAWVKLKEFTYASVAGATGHTTFSGSPLVSGAYTVQLRARRGARYAAGYLDPDPATWPLGSLGAGSIVVIAVPTNVHAAYNFDTGVVSTSWAVGDPGLALEVEIRTPVNDTPSYVTALAAKVAGSVNHAFPYAGGSVQDQARQLVNSSPLGASYPVGVVTARVRHIVGATKGAWVDAVEALAIEWSAGASDGASLAVNANQHSVGAGTDLHFALTRPTSQVGNLELSVVQAGGTWGSYPANAGCGSSSIVGGVLVSQTPLRTMLAITVPDTDPSPQTIGPYANGGCGACLLVGQQIAFGSATALHLFSKGTGLGLQYVYRQALNLPGSPLGSAPLVCAA